MMMSIMKTMNPQWQTSWNCSCSVWSDLEKKAMEHLQPRFWTLCVDNTFVVIKREDKSRFLDVLNGVCADIQFTCNEATGRPLTNENAPEGDPNEQSIVCL